MNSPVKRIGAPASSVLPQRRAPAAQAAAPQSLRVLQSARSPAQMSLFLRPSGAR